MPDPHAPSYLGEIALRRLAARAASHDSGHDHAPGSGPGRHLPPRELGRHINALVDLVAIAELYFSDRLAEAVPALATQPTTWRTRAVAWRDKAGVDLSAHPSWPAFMGFVEARNALQHGLGRLTDMQLDPKVPKKGGEPRRTQVLRQIAASGLHLNGDRVTVLGRDVERCGVVCRELLLEAEARLAAAR